MEIVTKQKSVPFSRPKFTVLVEEQALVRHLWIEHYKNQGWSLEVFENPLEFLEQLPRFSNRDEKMYFFFDQDFGRIRGVGTQLARAVERCNPHQTVSLVTNYCPEDFYKEIDSGLIQYVFDKYPRAIFGTGYLDNQLNQNHKIRTLLYADLSGRTALEKAMQFNGDRLEFTLENHFPRALPKRFVPGETLAVPSSASPATSIESKDPWWSWSFWNLIRSLFHKIFYRSEHPLLADDPNHFINADVIYRHWIESLRSRGIERSGII